MTLVLFVFSPPESTFAVMFLKVWFNKERGWGHKTGAEGIEWRSGLVP